MTTTVATHTHTLTLQCVGMSMCNVVTVNIIYRVCYKYTIIYFTTIIKASFLHYISLLTTTHHHQQQPIFSKVCSMYCSQAWLQHSVTVSVSVFPLSRQRILYVSASCFSVCVCTLLLLRSENAHIFFSCVQISSLFFLFSRAKGVTKPFGSAFSACYDTTYIVK